MVEQQPRAPAADEGALRDLVAPVPQVRVSLAAGAAPGLLQDQTHHHSPALRIAGIPIAGIPVRRAAGGAGLPVRCADDLPSRGGGGGTAGAVRAALLLPRAALVLRRAGS